MRAEDLKELLEKYYAVETTLEEEVMLRQFFDRNIIPEEFEAEREIFVHYSRTGKISEPSDDLEKKIMDAAVEQIYVRTSGRIKRIYLYISAVAAGILILAGIYLMFDRETGPADTYSDPETAYAATIEILHNVSSRFNRANRNLRPLGKIQEAGTLSLNAISRPANAFGKNMKNIEHVLREFEKVNTIKGDSSDN